MTEEEKTKNREILIDLERRTYRPDNIYSLRHPLCIITCHNRKPSILDNLSQFGTTPIYVFIYEFEREMYDFLEAPNINKVFVPDEYLTCQKMRVFVQNYMGREKYWVTDDDLRCVSMYEDKHEVCIGHALSMIEKLIQGQEFSAIGYGHVELATKFWTGNIMIPTYASVTLLYDGAKCEEIGLKYTGDSGVDESLEFIINSHLCGLPVKNCPWGLLVCYEPSGGKNSLASPPEKHQSMQEKIYIKYGSAVRISLEKRRGYTAHIVYSRINKERTYNPELLALCQAGDHPGIIQYLKNIKEEKDANKNKKKNDK